MPNLLVNRPMKLIRNLVNLKRMVFTVEFSEENTNESFSKVVFQIV